MKNPKGQQIAASEYFKKRGPKAVPILIAAIKAEKDPICRFWMFRAAADTHDPAVLPAIFEAAAKVPFPIDTLMPNQPALSINLNDFGDAGVRETMKALHAKQPWVRRAAIRLLMGVEQGPHAAAIAAAFSQARHDKDPYVVIDAMGRGPLGPRDYPLIMRFENSRDAMIRYWVLDLASRAKPASEKFLRIKHLIDPAEEVAVDFSMGWLQRFVTKSDYPVIARKMNEAKGRSRAYVANIMGYVRDPRAIPALRGLLQDPDKRVADAAFNAIRRIQGLLP